MTRVRARIAELEAAKSAWEETGPESEKRIAALEAENARLRSVVLACAAQLDVSTELADRIAELEAEVAALVKAGDAMAEQAAWFSLTLCLKGTIRETEIAEALDAWLAASGGSGK